MKAIFTILSMLLFTVALAQDKVFVHKATTGNSSGNVSTLDHPDLNGNSSANFIVTHNLDNEGVQYNDKVTGTWYNGSSWTVFNEDASTMVEGSSYNIYIPAGGKMISVEADGSSFDLELNDPAINGDPNAVMVYATYWNPNGVYNDNNYGFWYDTIAERWNIYNEDTAINIPAGAVFTILIDDSTGGATAFSHTATAPTSNYTVIDHPSLNNKPNAYPVVSPNWGTTGDPSNINIDSTIGVWYNGTNWTIYTEDVSTMPTNAKFNVYVADPTLGVEENESIAEISSYPNPTNGDVTFTSKEAITAISFYNILGQEVKQIYGNNSNNLTIDISGLAAGNYIAKVQAGTAVESVKLIKL
ncbi:T9SS type A sorting domain-containing protein [Marixanthomonas ophiurae]|nr:T9SS type A sorting domain-containing protein [Marixanthomonas ophiurae]